VEALATRSSAIETVVLSTCNRSEIYVASGGGDRVRDEIVEFLSEYHQLPPETFTPHLFSFEGTDAARHLFRVAAGLDSLVIGEPQIAGQVKDAFALAQAAETVGPMLHSLFTQAFAVAKRVRTDTEIARHAVSVSYAAVELARKIFAELAGKAVLLIGAGEMGQLAARHLVEHGAFPIYVANRTWSRAQDLARSLSGAAVPFQDVTDAMRRVDIVITSTGSPDPIIRAETVQRVMHDRRTRPLFFIDIAVPRDVEASVNTLDNVYCYDIDDLKQVVDANLRERQREAQRAEALVDREVGKFMLRLRDVEVVPTIVSLRQRLEDIRTGELQKALARLPEPSPEVRAAMEGLSAAIVNKILHTPITKLRESSRAGSGRSWTELVHELFGLGRRP
jgi:glutamyl-tRNA reductase